MKNIYIYIYEPEEFKKSKFVKILFFLEIKIDVPYFEGGGKKRKEKKNKTFQENFQNRKIKFRSIETAIHSIY